MVDGVAVDDAADTALEPTTEALVVTVQVTPMPLINPVTVMGEPEPEADTPPQVAV